MKYLALSGWLLAASAQAATTPSSLLALFNRIPSLPATAQEAATWVDKSGTLVEPRLLALNAELKAHQQAVGDIAAAKLGEQRAQAQAQVEDLSKGMASVGIDMQRMQSDPAYAQQMQERMKKMSPQELMAMSQQMSQPMNQDARIPNQAQAQVNDSAAVKSAAETGFVYSQGMQTRLQANITLWNAADTKVAAVYAPPIRVAAQKPAIEWENIGCNEQCRQQWDVYASQVLPIMIARENDILKIRNSTIHQQRNSVAEGIKQADALLTAANYGADAESQLHRLRLQEYDAAAVGEISQLLDRIEQSVRKAAGVVHCGTQPILAPHAVCR